MPNRLELPEEFQDMIEKREAEERRVSERRKADRRSPSDDE